MDNDCSLRKKYWVKSSNKIIPFISALDDKLVQNVDWEKTRIEELNICGTELSSDSLIIILTRLKNLRWLNASWLEQMDDKVFE